MVYEDRIQEKVRQHPMDEFAAMGDLSEMDNFGDQLADLLNALSTNVIIPVDNEDELKQWAADYAGGERVYGEINGEFTIAEPAVSSPSGPSDINLKSVSASAGPTVSDTEPSEPTEGDEWVDTSYASPAKKIYSDNEWKTLVEGSNVPGEKTYTSDKEVDVSNIDETVDVQLGGSRGREGDPDRHGDVHKGGSGGEVVCSIDLTTFDTLKIIRNAGGGGEGGLTSAGGGGDGMEIQASDGTTLCGAGGGGGGGSTTGAPTTLCGGDGGGPEGGSGGCGSRSGNGGGQMVANLPEVTEKATGSRSDTSPYVTLFSG